MCLEFTVIAYSWSCMTITNRTADALILLWERSYMFRLIKLYPL